MKGTILNIRTFELCKCIAKEKVHNFSRTYTSNEAMYTLQKKKKIHPYRKLHPWISHESFSQYLLDNIVYHKDGLVVINKPYGIACRRPNELSPETAHKMNTPVANAVNYTLSDSLTFLAQELGYNKLNIVKTQEKYSTGLTLLAANAAVEKAIKLSYNRAIGTNVLHKKYWVVTTKLSKEIEGNERLCLKKEVDRLTNSSKIIILDKWSTNDAKRHKIKLLNVSFKLISNSTNNLSSLIEIQSSTVKWHALRLYSATRLYAPILGDNLYSNRIQKIAGHWILVNPFLKSINIPNPSQELLELLQLTPAKTELIPCHIHARQILLLNFADKENLTLEAPLIPPFDWTCKQLCFKNIPELEET